MYGYMKVIKTFGLNITAHFLSNSFKNLFRDEAVSIQSMTD